MRNDFYFDAIMFFLIHLFHKYPHSRICMFILFISIFFQMYIGQMSLWFKNAALQNEITEEDEIKDIIEHNTMVFGFIQILCFVWAVPIGKYLLHPNFPLSDKPKVSFWIENCWSANRTRNQRQNLWPMTTALTRVSR